MYNLIKTTINMTTSQKTYFDKAKFLMIDMDGTLIDTDKANNEAYKYATLFVTGLALNINTVRVTSDVIYGLYTKDIASAIVSKKNEIYSDFLYLTKVNSDLLEIIMKCNKKCFLVSNCSPERGSKTLKYHLLDSLLDRNMFYSGDKFNQSINELQIDPKEVFVFENEMSQAKNAILAGINENSIYVFNN